jgi:hypothetical protein
MHFYTYDGEPAHTQKCGPKAKNKERPTDIRDARRLGLFASVTTILETIARPGLDHYKKTQLLEAAFQAGHHGGEGFAEWSKWVTDKADAGRDEAAVLGGRVHAAIEARLKDSESPILCDLEPLCAPALSYVAMLGIEQLESEQVTVNRALAYAGTIDVSGYICNPEGQVDLSPTCPLILDFKTKRTKPGEKIDVPETYPWQLAAYHVSKFGPCQRELHPLALACNVFISTTEPGRMEAVWYDREDLEHAWECYRACNRLFQLRNKLNYK